MATMFQHLEVPVDRRYCAVVESRQVESCSVAFDQKPIAVVVVVAGRVRGLID